MKAPDRIWILQGDLGEMLAWAPNRADTIVAAQFPLKNMNGEIASVEYVRKGAFPVEEVERIRELLITAIGLGDVTRTAGLHQGRAAQSVEALSRILSLLEDSE